MGTSRDDARGFVFAKYFSAPVKAFFHEKWRNSGFPKFHQSSHTINFKMKMKINSIFAVLPE
jgi:hypothetical protein